MGSNISLQLRDLINCINHKSWNYGNYENNDSIIINNTIINIKQANHFRIIFENFSQFNNNIIDYVINYYSSYNFSINQSILHLICYAIPLYLLNDEINNMNIIKFKILILKLIKQVDINHLDNLDNSIYHVLIAETGNMTYKLNSEQDEYIRLLNLLKLLELFFTNNFNQLKKKTCLLLYFINNIKLYHYKNKKIYLEIIKLICYSNDIDNIDISTKCIDDRIYIDFNILNINRDKKNVYKLFDNIINKIYNNINSQELIIDQLIDIAKQSLNKFSGPLSELSGPLGKFSGPLGKFSEPLGKENDTDLINKLYECINNFIYNFNKNILLKIKRLIKITNYNINANLSFKRITNYSHSYLKILLDLGYKINHLLVDKFFDIEKYDINKQESIIDFLIDIYMKNQNDENLIKIYEYINNFIYNFNEKNILKLKRLIEITNYNINANLSFKRINIYNHSYLKILLNLGYKIDHLLINKFIDIETIKHDEQGSIIDLLIDICMKNNNDKDLIKIIYKYINNFIYNFNNYNFLKLKRLIKITNYNINANLEIEKIKESKCNYLLLKALIDLEYKISYSHVKKFIVNIIKTIKTIKNDTNNQRIIIDLLINIFIECEHDIKLIKKINKCINNLICNFNDIFIFELKQLIEITNYDINTNLTIKKIKKNNINNSRFLTLLILKYKGNYLEFMYLNEINFTGIFDIVIKNKIDFSNSLDNIRKLKFNNRIINIIKTQKILYDQCDICYDDCMIIQCNYEHNTCFICHQKSKYDCVFCCR